MTGDEIANLPDQIDEPTAASLLRTLINNKYAAAVKNNLDLKGLTLSQNQFDALVIFAYNCGTGALFGSTLYKNICAGIRDADTIYNNFMMWNKGEIDGKMQAIAGLTKRRSAEANIFNNGDYSNRP
jgi:lysozyme